MADPDCEHCEATKAAARTAVAAMAQHALTEGEDEAASLAYADALHALFCTALGTTDLDSEVPRG